MFASVDVVLGGSLHVLQMQVEGEQCSSDLSVQIRSINPEVLDFGHRFNCETAECDLPMPGCLLIQSSDQIGHKCALKAPNLAKMLLPRH